MGIQNTKNFFELFRHKTHTCIKLILKDRNLWIIIDIILCIFEREEATH